VEICWSPAAPYLWNGTLSSTAAWRHRAAPLLLVVSHGDIFKSVAGKLDLNGKVEKDFEFNGGELTLNGTIGGASQLVAQNITIGGNAALRGPVRYWAEEGEISFGNALQNGATASFDPSL